MSLLSPRQQSIFCRVVDTHIETAQPVGSKSIADLYRSLYQGSYSSATVRHEMGRLEEMGYLTHPHTSAGRIPTDQGYRYYVDRHLHEKEDVSNLDASFEEEIKEETEDQDVVAEKISRKLSELSKQVALVIVPKKGTSNRFRVYIQGSSQIMEKPEFQSVRKVQTVFRALEETEDLSSWLTDLSHKTSGISVSIGQENQNEAFRECAVIASHCKADHQADGVVAVIGPTRMRYTETIPLVRHVARWTHRIFDHRRLGPFYG